MPVLRAGHGVISLSSSLPLPLGLKRVTGGFNSRTSAAARTYFYMLHVCLRP